MSTRADGDDGGQRLFPLSFPSFDRVTSASSLLSLDFLSRHKTVAAVFQTADARAVGMSVGGMARALEMTPRFDEGDRVTSLPRRSLPSVMTVVGIIS